MENNLKNDETIIEVAKTKGKLEAVKICKLLYGVNLKDAKDHVEEITKDFAPNLFPKNNKLKKRILFIGLPILILWIIGITVAPKSKLEKQNKESSLKPVNMDSLISVVKNDKLFEIKEVYYNKKDSSFSIAFTNKDNVIKENSFSPVYFDQTYHLDSIEQVEGVYLYAYKAGKSFSKGDYKNPLKYSSRKLGRLTDAFDKKYYSEYRATYTPLYDYLKENLNDPSSLEIVKCWNLGLNEDSTFEVKTTFRAKNGFGALTLQTVNCNIDRTGNVLNVVYNK